MTEPKQRRKPRNYTDEFKKQLVDLYHSGKHRCDLCREYDIVIPYLINGSSRPKTPVLFMKKTTVRQSRKN